MIFIDTCVLIDYSKGKIELNLKEHYFINSVVRMEFKIGARDKRELKKLNRILSTLNTLSMNQEILDLAEHLIDKYTLSHNLMLYDAIIAATCLVYGLELFTYNKKDFRYIEDLVLI